MIKVLRIGHATFETPDLAKAVDYYREVAGFSVVAREPNRALLATRMGHLAIELQQGSQSRCSKLSFEVPADADLADLKKELATHGVSAELRGDSIPGTPKLLAFADPKGTVIELFNEWSFVDTREPTAGVGALKLGHVAFSVHDPKAMAEFYGKVLGFRVSDWIGDFFVFMRCNADHHTVNFLTGKTEKMHHIAFELKDASHLQNACDLFGERKIPIIWGPVRLGPGHNVATFHRNSDDWVVEFYAELDQMKNEELGYYDPRPWHQDRPQRPKVWDPKNLAYIWGMPPGAEFFRGRE